MVYSKGLNVIKLIKNNLKLGKMLFFLIKECILKLYIYKMSNLMKFIVFIVFIFINVFEYFKNVYRKL